ENSRWQFVGVAKPAGTIDNESVMIAQMEQKYREYLLNLPLYDGITSLEIGIDEGSSISKPRRKIIDSKNPIVFYGTSITQGASASRPGLTYAALLERNLNTEVINLGFSGNGKFDKEVAGYIMEAKPALIVLDCTPNSTAAEIKHNLPETLDYIKSVSDTTPIILLESIVRDFAYFKKDDEKVFGTMSFIKGQNNELKKVYETKIENYKNIFYLSSENLIGQDHEATIDGTHFNDLGHYRAYEYIKPVIQKVLRP